VHGWWLLAGHWTSNMARSRKHRDSIHAVASEQGGDEGPQF